MAIAVAVTSVDNTQNQFIVDGTLTLSGNYVAHGDTINLTGFDAVKAQGAPTRIEVFETGAAASDPLSELAAGAYPAGLTGAVVKFRAWIPSFV